MIVLAVLLFSAQVLGGEIEQKIHSSLGHSFSGANIQLIGPVRWVRDEAPEGSELLYLQEDGMGRAHFSFQDPTGKKTHEGSATFNAKKNVLQATERLQKGDPLKKDSFEVRALDVSRGVNREFQKSYLSLKEDLSQWEAIQTISEGEILSRLAIRKIPSVRKGDPLHIQIVSGGMVISTTGFAQDLGYLNQALRATSGKSRKELSGVLMPGNILEVRL